MLSKKRIIAGALLLILALGTWALAAGQIVEQKSVLTGSVLAAGLVQVNAKVREGDVLVNVSTITGSAVAVRATVDGVVQAVLVKPGDKAKAGDVLVRIQASR